MDLKAIFSEKLEESLDGLLTNEEIYQLIEIPKNTEHGDFAFPCFQLAKLQRKSPVEIAKQLEGMLIGGDFREVTAVGPYVNVSLKREMIVKTIVNEVLYKGNSYGQRTTGEGKTVVLDMSSPNIAKPFSMGHLRSTVIGNAIANIAKKCGYKTVKINYIGDWGTQFGKLIVAYQKWGDEQKVREQPISELFKLYVQFHKEAEDNPDLEMEGRAAFKQLEDGNESAVTIWKWFRDESLNAFMKIYDLLGIEFDSFNGEAFYNDKMETVVEKLKSQNLLVKSEGAEVVSLENEGLPPCLIKKSDGATLYATRDLAAAIDRQQKYEFNEAIYVVGQEQTIHFKQVKSVLKKLGYQWADEMKHISFGLYQQNGKKMSTRKGRVILLEEVLLEAVKLAQKNIQDKNPHLENANEVSTAVGVGAIIFHDLKNDRLNSIEFSLKEMLTFEGETGPYIQYTHARAHSILEKALVDESLTFTGLNEKESWEIIKSLNQFPYILEKSYSQYSPSILAKFLLQLSQSFNKYYAKVRILQNDQDRESRLALVKAVTIVLEEGLKLLGIKAPKKM